MRAAILRRASMVVDELPALTPGRGQVLVDTIACGICGSDLHTVDGAHEMVAVSADADSPLFGFDPEADLVMGHEISVRVVATGEGVDPSMTGLEAAAMPSLVVDGHRVVPGYDNRYPGGYCEQLLLDPAALVPIPNGLDPAIAALTEPLAVGLHAANQAALERNRAAIVIGAGPVGLSVIAALAAAGVAPIIAADLSPRRRALATHLGAHVVVDPGEADDRRTGLQLVVDAWRHAGGGTPPVVFEAVGVPGMLDAAMAAAPAGSELVVVGVCMQPDRIRPMMGILKHLTLRFVLGWTPSEFVASLHNLAEGRIDGAAFVTGQVGLDDVPAAFAALADPEDHVKILVRPNGGAD
ncbi:MAG: zinc-binding dehydrogenase [Acidimicrobiales bacterium]